MKRKDQSFVDYVTDRLCIAMEHINKGNSLALSLTVSGLFREAMKEKDRQKQIKESKNVETVVS